MWSDFISVHPWDIDVRAIEPCLFEIYAVMREPAPLDLSMIFSEWLAAIRAALDNGMYAWVSAATGQNPPPQAERIQYPACATPKEFKEQRRRLSAVPAEIMDRVERAQPYQSPLGPQSNLTYWIHEFARTDRHRSAHMGVGRIAEHKVRLGLPEGVTAEFGGTVKPFQHIDGELVVGRFRTSVPTRPRKIVVDLRGVGIDPDILAWAEFRLDGRRTSLWHRMVYAEILTRNALENMALFSNVTPPGGFKTFDPTTAEPDPA